MTAGSAAPAVATRPPAVAVPLRPPLPATSSSLRAVGRALALAGLVVMALAAPAHAQTAATASAKPATPPAAPSPAEPATPSTRPATPPATAGDKAAGGARRDPSRPQGDRLLTPAQIKACLAQRDAMRGAVDGVQKEKAELDAERSAIEKDGATIDAEATTLDRTSIEAVDAHNRRIEERNRRVDAWQARVAAYNGRAERASVQQTDYRKSCEQRRYDERDLVDVQPERNARPRKK